jgi:hypothetical protein
VTGVDHPKWCKPRLCTAAVDGLPFAEGEHRSETVRLATELIVWPVQDTVVSAYLTQRTPSTAWPTTPYLHIQSSVHGVIAHLPLEVFFTVVGQVGQLAQIVTPPAGAPASAVPPPAATRRLQWPTRPGGAA